MNNDHPDIDGGELRKRAEGNGWSYERLLSEAHSALDKATAECAVLREALQWYAEAETYRYQSMKTFPPVMSDCGERARKALSKTPTLGTRLLDVVERTQKVIETFEKDEAQGFRSRDRQYAIEMLRPMLDALSKLKEG